MRADAAGEEFAEAPEIVGCVVNPDHAAGVVEIVFGRVEQPPVRRENAVAVEVPAFDSRDRRPPETGTRKHQRKITRLAAEDDEPAGDGALGNVVTAVR